MALHKLIFDPTDANTRGDTHTVGAVLYDKANDRLGVINASNELLVHDEDVKVALGDLSHLEDSAHVSGDKGMLPLAVRNDTEGSLVDADGDYAPLQVDSSGRLRVIADVDVGIDAEKNEDAVHASGDTGNYILSVRADARPTNANTSADGDYASFFVNANGELYVHDFDANALLTTIDADTGSILTEIQSLSHNEDVAHVSGDTGLMSLAVRNDTLASLVDADGDYAPLQVNASGALYVEVAGGTDDALANSGIKQVAETVGTVAAAIVDGVDELASRKYIYIYNNDNRDVFIGDSGVSVANGFPIPPGAILEARIGDAVDVYMIGDKAGTDVRTLQLS